MPIQYRRILPQKSLLHSVEAYCLYEKDDENTIADYFFPNGKPAVIFHLQNPFSYLYPEGEWVLMPAVSFVNCVTSAISLKSEGRTDTIAVVLKPSSIYAIYHLILNNSNKPTDALPYVGKELFTQLKENKNPEYRAKLLDDYFTGKLNNYNPEKDMFKQICDYVISKCGIIERGAVARKYDISESYVHKIFMQRIGVSFKPFAQVVRVSNVIQELYSGDKYDCFEILLKYGYFDQSHFIKEFKKLTGKTPHEYYSFDKRMSVMFSGMDESVI